MTVLTPGWHALSGRSIYVPDTATRVGPHNGDTRRVCDPPDGTEAGKDVPQRVT